MNTAIMVVVIMGMVGISFGLILAYADKKFAMEVNPLIHIVEDILPKGQCGSCGYAGCAAYAEAVVLDENVPPNLCTPGKERVAKLVAELTGKKAAAVEPKIAQVRCAGTKCNAVSNYNYDGVQDCVAASLVLGGPKGCQYGCLGFGTCVKTCPFGALSMGEDGLPMVDEEICTGCAKCEASCPKKVISMVLQGAPVKIACNSKDKGAAAKKLCSAACIGCGICARSCPNGAIKVENNLAIVEAQVCKEKCSSTDCLLKCPTGAIKAAVN